MDGTHSYADLDELIVNHVQAMARRVEELMNHEKFKTGSEDDLRQSLGCMLCILLVADDSYRPVLEKLSRCQSS